MDQLSTIPAIVLAAGQSSRMRGTDKLLQDVDGQPLIRRQCQMARQVCERVYVTLPPLPHDRYTAISGLDVTPVSVANAAEGMGASLRAGFAALPADAQAALLLLGDLPDLTAEDLSTVLQAVDLTSDNLIWRGTTSEGRAGHPIVFAKSLFAEFATLTGDNGGQSIVAFAGDRVAHIALSGNRARNDLDTPEEWANWRALRD
ncbi:MULTISPECIES: nucleotidyltransferase family protein [Roseobacteraceae]|uniref:Molybdopterin-guanine dinucleotide biosynthesis protein A n=1 Tax=Pseudosulfitobacter pseudonitzschiae TaxID=1402135 RepID=A0A221K0P2_9RHOB|nr:MULTISPECIES: NTP transferase domain-containing protein [Roseobacteraceae]ASM72541.1 molybdopterin-guanine dinucleotide biosynthesis protein A [Pseudosulfitobacter pseudonitzschiae]